jgi:nucleoid DNA-binding protein
MPCSAPSTSALKGGDEVRLRRVRHLRRHPPQGQQGPRPAHRQAEIDIAATSSVRFKAGKGLKDGLGG